MLLKRKIVQTKPEAPAPYGAELVMAEGEISRAKLGRLLEFNKQIQASDPKHMWGILREWNEKLFGEFPDPDTHHQMLLLRIQYELVHLDYKEQKIKIPPRLAQNIEASKHYQIEKLAPSLRGIMESLTKGENMSVKVKTAPVNRVAKTVTGPVVSRITPTGKEKVNKESVTQTYIRLFQENATKKLLDSELAAEMRKAHPDKKKYTEADIAGIRSLYNRGGLSGQAKAPAVKCVEVAMTANPNNSKKK